MNGRARPPPEFFRDPASSTSGENTETESAAPKKTMEWSADNEEILVEWGDTAQCYKWLHTECHRRVSAQHAWFTVPTIIFSTIAGTASFAQSSLSTGAQFYASLAIGTVNIFVGILGTVQEYLKISERRESHRVAAVSWDKFARNVRVELAKTPLERADAHHFIKVCRLEYDRLMETSPLVRPDVVAKFFKTFAGGADSAERAHFEALKKPDICNSIVSMNETRRRWFEDHQTRAVRQLGRTRSGRRGAPDPTFPSGAEGAPAPFYMPVGPKGSGKYSGAVGARGYADGYAESCADIFLEAGLDLEAGMRGPPADETFPPDAIPPPEEGARERDSRLAS